MTSDVRLIQISDPHLVADPNGVLRGVESLSALQRVLSHALSKRSPPDAVLCTGDIVNDDAGGYAHFVRELGSRGCPVPCVPGNHDDTTSIRRYLNNAPFQLGGYVDLGAHWRLMLVDSCIPGEAGGRVSQHELRQLDSALSSTDRYAMVCLHHHPVSMASNWLDQVGVQNAGELFEVLDRHARVRVISWGHVHQCFEARRHGVRLLGTPSTGGQFLPLSDDFAIDSRPPAYRRLTLLPDGTLDTEVVWVEAAAQTLASASG